MRNKETHFEQVPIEVVETVLRQTAALEKIPEKLLDSTPTPGPRAEAESLEQEERTASKGQL